MKKQNKNVGNRFILLANKWKGIIFSSNISGLLTAGREMQKSPSFKAQRQALALHLGAISVLLLLLLTFLLFSCAKPETVLRLAVSNMNENFDPIKITDENICHIKKNVFETLLIIENGHPKPILAENWFWYGDSLFVVNIKENIRFSNNTLLAGSDVEKSFIRALNHPESVHNVYKEYIDELFVSGYSMHIYYNKFDHIFEMLSKVPIYNGDFIDSFDDTILRVNPLSTGKYFLFSRTEDKIVLKKNPYHASHKKGCQNFDVIEIIHEPNVYRQYQMLLDNELDFIFQVPISVYAHAFSNPNITIIEIESKDIILMMLDSESIQSPSINTPTNPLRDSRVRNAIAHAIDTESFINRTLLGKANILSIPCFMYIQGYPVDKRNYTYDLEMSKELMEEAGFRNGFDMVLRVFENEYTITLADFIKESLADINIDLKVEFVMAENLDTQRVDLTMMSAILLEKEAKDEMTLEDLLGDIYYFPKSETRGRYNFMNYSNSEITGLLDTLYNLPLYDTSRMRIYAQLSEKVYEEAYVIPFFQPINVYAASNRVAFSFRENFNCSDFRMK